MELPWHQDQSQSERKKQNRKLEEEIGEDRREVTTTACGDDARKAILVQVAEQVNIFDSSFSWTEAVRNAAKRTTHVLAELGKTDVVNVIVEVGAVPALVKHLQAPPCSEVDWSSMKHCEHEVEKGSAFALARSSRR